MPHKHTRKGPTDKSTTDLPPTTLATPLPVSKSANENGVFTSSLTNTRRGNKRKRNVDTADDTPKAFARLMAFSAGKRMAKGLDDGVRVPKKKKIKVEEDAGLPAKQEEQAVAKTPMPTIKPGERMAEFSARVDAALPVSGLINKTAKGGKDPLGLKVGRTKKEKKMQRMYAEWREQDVRIKEKREAALEEKEMDELEEGEGGQVVWADSSASTSSSKKKKGKGKKKKVVGEIEDGENDPWAKIQRERGGKVAFGDVVQAPPVFTKAPREKFKVRGAGVEVGDVPKASGSLRRREELGEVRRSIVEGYRAMMNQGKGNGGSRGGGKEDE